MPEITLPNNWDPRPYQMPCWTYLERGGKRAVVRAHRRWGKDDICLHWTAVAAMRRAGTYWHCLPEYAQARKAIWQQVNPHTGKRRIDEAFPPAIRKKINDQEMRIEFLNGSTWQLVGSDSYDSLVGSSPAGIVFSEYALAKPESWDFFRPMLAENGGWALFVSTVRGRNHFYQIGEYAKTRDDWYFIDSTVDTTGVFSRETLDRELSELIAAWGEEIGLAKFRQEYHNDPDVGTFAAFISSSMVQRGVQYQSVGHETEAIVWGLDVARQGSDWSALIQRQGRKVDVVDRWHEPDSMRLASLVAGLWDTRRPDMLFVDGGGVGGPVADRLKQLIPREAVAEVNFGWRANDSAKYANKRAEMWGKAKDALSVGLDLPDHKDLIEELSFPEFAFTAKNQIILEKKEAMSARGLHSPDHADGLVLTFAEPVIKRRAWEDQPEDEGWERFSQGGGANSWLGH